MLDTFTRMIERQANAIRHYKTSKNEIDDVKTR